MAIDRVKAYLRERGMEARVLEFETSSATVELAAQAVGCEPARIAKTLSFHVGDRVALVVAAGDARIDNPKYKAQFGCKAKMLAADEAEPLIGHGVGGVCPFAVNEGVDVFLDESLRRFDTVYPGGRQRGERRAPLARRARALRRALHVGRRVQAAMTGAGRCRACRRAACGRRRREICAPCGRPASCGPLRRGRGARDVLRGAPRPDVVQCHGQGAGLVRHAAHGRRRARRRGARPRSGRVDFTAAFSSDSGRAV